MNENQENNVEEVKQETDIKQETVKTFNEAKEQMKNINFKEEAEAGKGLLKKLCKSPIETIKEIAVDKENKVFKTALLLVAIWAIIELVDRILYYALSEYLDFNFLSTLKVTVAPILRVIAMTAALYFVNNRAKTSISKVLTSVSIAFIPEIVSSLLWLLAHISSNMSTILSPVGGLLSVISVVLMYHTTKEFVNKDNEENAFKDFIKVEGIFYVIALAFTFLGIYL